MAQLLSEHPFGGGGVRARKFELSNRLGVILVADRAAPVCAYQTWFRVGSRDEREGRTGIAHLFEHLMFNETEGLPPGEFDRRLEAVGADTNAATWLDWTYYRDNLPSRHLSRVMELEAERMARLVIHEPQLEAERSVVANERRQRVDDDVDGFLAEELYRLAYAVHPYRWPTIGWMDDILAIGLEDARAFYRTYYAPNNATVVIAGDLDEERTLGELERWYGALAPAVIPPRAEIEEPPQREARRAVFQKPVMADRILIGWRGTGIADPDHAALEVIAELLCNGQSSTLYRRLVVEREAASDVSADAPAFRDPGLFEIRASLQRGREAGEVEAVVAEELARLAADPPGPALLAKARNRLEARLWHHLRPLEGKAEALGHHECTAGDYRLLFTVAQRIRRVTSEDVARVAGRYLAPERQSVVIAQPRQRRSRRGAA